MVSGEPKIIIIKLLDLDITQAGRCPRLNPSSSLFWDFILFIYFVIGG